MPQFNVNPKRFDPYKNFKFKIKFSESANYIAGISKVSGLKRKTEVVTHREGGDPSTSHKSPGRTEYEAITLERGVTHDIDFEQWANRVWNYSTPTPNAETKEVALAGFRRNLVLDLFNETGQKVITYNIYNCWVSEYQALPDLDANANAIAIQTIKLENEGWERETKTQEPQQISFDNPTN